MRTFVIVKTGATLLRLGFKLSMKNGKILNLFCNKKTRELMPTLNNSDNDDNNSRTSRRIGGGGGRVGVVG
jgi:hypothetical protein